MLPSRYISNSVLCLNSPQQNKLPNNGVLHEHINQTTCCYHDLICSSHAATPLTLDVYNADGNSFHVNATVVYGETEAMVVDTGFTKADALRIGAKVLDSGKTLKTIFISQADPDYYFGAEVLKQMFPQAEVIATPGVKAKIEQKLQGKLDFGHRKWAPMRQ